LGRVFFSVFHCHDVMDSISGRGGVVRTLLTEGSVPMLFASNVLPLQPARGFEVRLFVMLSEQWRLCFPAFTESEQVIKLHNLTPEELNFFVTETITSLSSKCVSDPVFGQASGLIAQ